MILPYCIPTGNLERSNCTISLSTLGMVNIFILAILSTMFHHTMVLICISLMTYHVLHFFNVIIWKKNITFANLFSELQLIFIRLFFFLILNFKSIFMYYLYKYQICKYFLHALLALSFLFLIASNSLIFFFMEFAFDISKNFLHFQGQKNVFLSII